MLRNLWKAVFMWMFKWNFKWIFKWNFKWIFKWNFKWIFTWIVIWTFTWNSEWIFTWIFQWIFTWKWPSRAFVLRKDYEIVKTRPLEKIIIFKNECSYRTLILNNFYILMHFIVLKYFSALQTVCIQEIVVFLSGQVLVSTLKWLQGGWGTRNPVLERIVKLRQTIIFLAVQTCCCNQI